LFFGITGPAVVPLIHAAYPANCLWFLNNYIHIEGGMKNGSQVKGFLFFVYFFREFHYAFFVQFFKLFKSNNDNCLIFIARQSNMFYQ
jgi:hypothetical protein